MPDVILDGFGNSGYYQFATPTTGAVPNANNARLAKRIRGSRAGVDVLVVDGFTLWSGTEPLANLFGAMQPLCALEIFRTSIQAGNTIPASINIGNPGGSVPTVSYPAGWESLWSNYIIGPAANTPITAATNGSWNANAPGKNSYRFPPATLRVYEDQMLWVVMYGAMNFGSGTNFPATSQLVNHYRMLSVLGVDYGRFSDSAGNVGNARSIPRSF